MDILICLSKVTDNRRKQGLRYPLDKIIVLMLIGTMAGCEGYRSVARYCKRHSRYLSEVLGLKHGVPSHVSLTAIVDGIDLDSLEVALTEWGVNQLVKEGLKDNVIAVDGKSIKSSVKSGGSEHQNFISVVNAFCVEQKLVISSLSFENKHQDEGQMVRQMINMLGIKGALFTLDANHASKKR